MSGDPILASLMRDVLAPVVLALASGLAAWVLARLPGPIRDSMASAIHARDVALLNGTMQRRAVAQVADPATPSPTPGEIVAYVETVLPGLLAKMQLPAAGLETMAAAAVVKAEAEVVPAAGSVQAIR